MKKETAKIVGENLKTLRLVHNLSQDDIVEYTGSCRSIYTHYELGTRTPDPESLYIITSKLGIEMSALFEPDHDTFMKILASSTALTKDAQKLLRLYNRMSPYHKGSLMERAIVLTELEDEDIEKRKSMMTKSI